MVTAIRWWAAAPSPGHFLPRNRIKLAILHWHQLLDGQHQGIILLGESVISISAALADIAWTPSNVIAAVSGFVMVSAIWWIYYDSFHLLEQRKLTTGHSILYSHFFLFIGLAILASLIRHAILGGLDPGDFRQLTAAGMVLFFLGKQYGYYMEVPELRPYLLSNTAAVFALTATRWCWVNPHGPEAVSPAFSELSQRRGFAPLFPGNSGCFRRRRLDNVETFQSLPLDCGRRLPRDVIDHSRDSLHLVYDAA